MRVLIIGAGDIEVAKLADTLKGLGRDILFITSDEAHRVEGPDIILGPVRDWPVPEPRPKPTQPFWTNKRKGRRNGY